MCFVQVLCRGLGGIPDWGEFLGASSSGEGQSSPRFPGTVPLLYPLGFYPIASKFPPLKNSCLIFLASLLIFLWVFSS